MFETFNNQQLIKIFLKFEIKESQGLNESVLLSKPEKDYFTFESIIESQEETNPNHLKS